MIMVRKPAPFFEKKDVEEPVSTEESLSEIQTDAALLQNPEPFVHYEDVEKAVNDEENLSDSRTKHSGTSPDNESGTLQNRAKHLESLQCMRKRVKFYKHEVHVFNKRMEPGGSISNNLVDKIRNIDGKIIKEGKLRSAMRGVVQVGSYVESLDGSIRAKDLKDYVLNITTQKTSFGALTDDEEKGDMTTLFLMKIVIVKKLMRRWCLTIAMVKRLLLREQALPLVRFPMINVAESTASSSCIDIAMREFKDCVNNIEVLDVQNTGLQFTWNQKPKGTDGILKENADPHDRFKDVVNEAWIYLVRGFICYTNGFDGSNLFSNCLDEQGAAHMVRMVTDREITEAYVFMGG
ncbi:hypothetical protein Tco_1446336 [Tanacetum coccineum]